MNSLNLGNNKLSSLDKDIFDGLDSLNLIYLIGNKLTCLPKNMDNKDKIAEQSIKSLPNCLDVTVSPNSLSVTEGSTASYNLVLDTQPSGDVTVTSSSGDIAVVTVSPTSLTFTTQNWDTAQSVTVTGIVDDDAISNTVTISHSISGGGYGSVTVSDVSVTATDSNAAPKVENAILDQTATEDTAFTYTFPENTFSDPNAGDTLIYTALLSDDSALPNWLTFNATTRTFSGTPAEADSGTLSVKVTASDSKLSVDDTFTLTVKLLPRFSSTMSPFTTEVEGTILCQILKRGTQPSPLVVNTGSARPATSWPPARLAQRPSPRKQGQSKLLLLS